MFFHVLSCSLMFSHVLSCSLMFFHSLSCSLMFLSCSFCFSFSLLGAQNLIFLGLNFVTISLDSSYVKKQLILATHLGGGRGEGGVKYPFGPSFPLFFLLFFVFFLAFFHFSHFCSFLHFLIFLNVFHYLFSCISFKCVSLHGDVVS